MKTHERILAIAKTDRTFERVELRGGTGWAGKCLHCRRKLLLDDDGRPLGRVTIEHIVPKHHGGDDDPRNLGLACARCNNGKGVRIDVLRTSDPRYQQVIGKLQAERAKRWRDDAEE